MTGAELVGRTVELVTERGAWHVVRVDSDGRTLHVAPITPAGRVVGSACTLADAGDVAAVR